MLRHELVPEALGLHRTKLKKQRQPEWAPPILAILRDGPVFSWEYSNGWKGQS